MSGAGRIAIVLVLLFLLVVGLRQSSSIGKAMDKMLPEAVVQWFDGESGSSSPGRGSASRAVESVSRALGPVDPSKPPEGFGVGSSEEEVRAIQGTPSRMAPGVWHYGESEVQFVGGRVVAWRDSKRNPLRIR
jgi:hypothetical protein